MTGESDNLPLGGTDTADTSLSLDDAANLDIYDPDEDNVETADNQQSESETDEADDGQETEETIAEDDDQSEDEGEGAETAANPEPKDDVTVTVNGEQIALSDLKAGYLRQQDYSRKTQDIANTRRELEVISARVNNSVDAIAEFLANQLPPAPDPSLAMTNPGEYVQKKAMHDAAMSQISAILSHSGQVKDAGNRLTEQQRSELIAQENAKLAEAFPATATTEGRKKFFESAASAARQLGYSDADISKETDHRMFQLAHYAAIGLRAEQAKAKAVKKVEKVPPVAPQKRVQGANASKLARNKDAMKRLTRTGSLADALAIDFD